MITTATRSNWLNDFPLKEWAQAGLPHTSLVRAKLFTLDERLILRRRGEATQIDQQAITKSLRSILPLHI
ncbi:MULTISPECIES: transcriptional modulator of MazE/toxin MazF [unclassified Lentimonas]|uniref:transcriptional modulator of MazE/toxin MazF n=1 Tax=unclassified Lentimonas TaxID=2630993 RepID=UPI0013896804|nr:MULTISPECIES: transcriptional modulator of MazE/toxin MazF [unclassified Lentimonas]